MFDELASSRELLRWRSDTATADGLGMTRPVTDRKRANAEHFRSPPGIEDEAELSCSPDRPSYEPRARVDLPDLPHCESSPNI